MRGGQSARLIYGVAAM